MNDALDQVVFRWDGNQGRSSAGMAAVARSCSPERADALGRELGPLLWVSGPSPRPSSVRVRSRSGATLLVQRWPVTDRGGRPSTACHVLIGDGNTLNPMWCLGLGGTAWSDPTTAETASGRLPVLDGAQLGAAAKHQLSAMTDQLPSVREPLVTVVAEWLRDPDRRLSLLAEEDALPGWPQRNTAPLLYLGLLSLFGNWTGKEWSYATYDTEDTHPLRLTCVPRWSSQPAGAGAPARVRLRLPAERDVESYAALEMVDYMLARPGARPGVPHLTGELTDGARMDRRERREALRRMLHTGGRAAPQPRAPQLPASQHPAQQHPARQPSAPQPSAPQHPAQQPPAPQPSAPQHPAQQPPAPQPVPQQLPAPRPEPQEPLDHRDHRDHREPPHHQHQQHHQGPQHPQDPSHHQDRHDRQQLQYLLTDLLAHRRADTVGSTRLADRLQEIPDGPLLILLRAEDLPWASLDLLLAELAHPDRLRTRDEKTAYELCTEVLRHNLYFRPARRREADTPSLPEMYERAGDLFSWAVAPLVRDPRHTPDLGVLLNIVLRDGHANGREWLRRLLVSPPGGRAPDLPPQLWQRVVTDLLTIEEPPPPPPPPTTPPPPPPRADPPPPLPAPYVQTSTQPPYRPTHTPPPTTAPTAPTAEEEPARETRFHLPGLSELIYKTWFIVGLIAIALTAVLALIAIVIN
ncbi:hypothetical protein [Streptomyces cyaneofuscatus]|uniref:hypothetical protein n=1 Tax=Streptomyces cyaneofuscatus TaxID=66883 RepID=UPI0036DEC6F4